MILLLISGLWPQSAISAEMVVNANLEFSILRHAPLDAGLNDVCCGTLADNFTPAASGKFLTGFGEKVYWLRIDRLDKPGVLKLGPMLDEVTIYRRDKITGKVQSSQAGDILPASGREILSGTIAFPIGEEDLQRQIFLRIFQQKIISVTPIMIDRTIFENQRLKTNLIHAGLIGAVFMIILFNAFLGLLIRRKLFLLNAATILSVMIEHLYFSGLGAAYVWGRWPWISNSLFDITVIISIVVGSLFSYTFLKTEGRNPLLVRLFLWFPVLAVLLYLFWLISPVWISQIGLLAINFVLLSYCLIAVGILNHQGHERARLMFPGLLLALIPGFILLTYSKFFSGTSIVPAEHIYELIMIVEAMAFTLILSYRIRLAETESITAFTKLKAVQQGINRQLINSIDEERRRIASDLHDTAGQGLIAITTRLSRLVSKNKLGKSEQDEVSKVADYSREVVGEIRRISYDLHPAIIDHLGWKNAIEELFATLSEVEQIAIDLQLDIEEDFLDDNQKILLFRIVQEILTNIAKHANATSCRARFFMAGQSFNAIISDNGANVNPDDAVHENSVSLGHTIINQRMSLLGGEWLLKKHLKNTIVELNFPINK